MAPVLAPWQAGWEIVCCLYLGALVGALRALAPGKGRGAFLPDVALVGMLLLFLQSYAAGYSDAGSLRWYMLAACFLGALGAHSLLGPLAGRAWALVLWPWRAAGRWLKRSCFGPVGRAWRARRLRRAQKTAKTAAENQKKSLQNTPHLLYNSNV